MELTLHFIGLYYLYTLTGRAQPFITWSIFYYILLDMHSRQRVNGLTLLAEYVLMYL